MTGSWSGPTTVSVIQNLEKLQLGLKSSCVHVNKRQQKRFAESTMLHCPNLVINSAI